MLVMLRCCLSICRLRFQPLLNSSPQYSHTEGGGPGFCSTPPMRSISWISLVEGGACCISSMFVVVIPILGWKSSRLKGGGVCKMKCSIRRRRRSPPQYALIMFLIVLWSRFEHPWDMFFASVELVCCMECDLWGSLPMTDLQASRDIILKAINSYYSCYQIYFLIYTVARWEKFFLSIHPSI